MTPDLRWRTGLLAVALTAAIGAACALFALHQLRAGSARAAMDDAQAMAQSVAQTLAQQLGRAARLGIPLPQLPGVPAYLQAALERQPALRSIAVLQPDGSALYQAQARHAGAGSSGGSEAAAVRVPIPVAGAGSVAVGLASGGAAESGSLARAAWCSAAAVLLLALCAGLGAALGPGARLERQRRELLARLHPGAAPAPHTGLAGTDGLHPALQALAQGDADADAAREAVHAYAQELLAIDFEGQMRAEVERIVQDC